MVWFIHDIDPIQAQYECKFTAYIEWISPNAVGLPEQRRLSKEELISGLAYNELLYYGIFIYQTFIMKIN